MATKTSTPPKPKLLKILGIAAVVLILLGVGTYLFLIQREKAQFAQAEKEMDALYAQIVEKVGKPDQEKKEKSCGYASRVYDKGPLACSFYHSVTFKAANVDEANILMKKTAGVVGTKLYGSFGKSDQTTFSSITDEELSQPISTRTVWGGTCGIDYVYPLSKTRTDRFSFGKEGDLELVIACGAPALKEYFPVKE